MLTPPPRAAADDRCGRNGRTGYYENEAHLGDGRRPSVDPAESWRREGPRQQELGGTSRQPTPWDRDYQHGRDDLTDMRPNEEMRRWGRPAFEDEVDGSDHFRRLPQPSWSQSPAMSHSAAPIPQTTTFTISKASTGTSQRVHETVPSDPEDVPEEECRRGGRKVKGRGRGRN